jgi:hypothetical protein
MERSERDEIVREYPGGLHNHQFYIPAGNYIHQEWFKYGRSERYYSEIRSAISIFTASRNQAQRCK